MTPLVLRMAVGVSNCLPLGDMSARLTLFHKKNIYIEVNIQVYNMLILNKKNAISMRSKFLTAEELLEGSSLHYIHCILLIEAKQG